VGARCANANAIANIQGSGALGGSQKAWRRVLTVRRLAGAVKVVTAFDLEFRP
jgi:hypothetical protein